MSYEVSKKVTRKTCDNGLACNPSKVNGLFTESFFNWEKRNSHFEVPEEVLTENAAKLDRDTDIENNRIEKRLCENMIPEAYTKLYKEGRVKIFTSLLTRALMESLEFPIDVVESFYGNIQAMCESYAKNRYDLLEANHKKNIVLEGMYQLCESTAKSVAKAKCDSCKNMNDIKCIKFNMDDEQKKEFMDGVKKIDFGVVANMVRDKVVNVVKDEQERAAKRQEYRDEVEGKVSEIAMTEGLSPLNPFFSPLVSNYRDTQKIDKTLFQCMMENTTSELLESVVLNAQPLQPYGMRDDDENDDDFQDERIPGAPDSNRPYDTVNNDIRKIDEFQGNDDDDDDDNYVQDEKYPGTSDPDTVCNSLNKNDDESCRATGVIHPSIQDPNSADDDGEVDIRKNDEIQCNDECGNDDVAQGERYPGTPNPYRTYNAMDNNVRKTDDFQGNYDDEDDIDDVHDEDDVDNYEGNNMTKREDCIGVVCKDDEENPENQCPYSQYVAARQEPVMEKPCQQPCDEAINVKQQIHKRAKKFKNVIFKRAFRESVEPQQNVNMDEVFMESFMNYTMIELAHTLGLDPMTHDKVKSLIQTGIKSMKK